MNNLLQLLGSIRNPQKFVQDAMSNSAYKNNPVIQNALKMYQSNDVNGLKNLANNICNEHGISADEIRSKLGM